MAASTGKQVLRRNIIALFNYTQSISRSRCKCDFTKSNDISIAKNKSTGQTKQAVCASSISNPPVSENESNEDFFGISDGFKLQHARFDRPELKSVNHAKTDLQSKSSVYGVIDEERSSNIQKPDPDLDLHANRPNGQIVQEISDQFVSFDQDSVQLQESSQTRHKRRKRKVMKADFPTSFGIISFDQAAFVKSQGNIETLAAKAQEITKTSENKYHGVKQSRGYIHEIPGNKGKEVDSNLNKKFQRKNPSLQNSDNNGDFYLLKNKWNSHNDKEKKSKTFKQNQSVDNQNDLNIFDEQYFSSMLPEKEASPSFSKANVIEEQYFANQQTFSPNFTKKKEYKHEERALNTSKNHAEPQKNTIFEEQYFGNRLIQEEAGESPSLKNTPCESFTRELLPSMDTQLCSMDDGLNEMDRQYFGQPVMSQFHLESEATSSLELEGLAQHYNGIVNNSSKEPSGLHKSKQNQATGDYNPSCYSSLQSFSDKKCEVESKRKIEEGSVENDSNDNNNNMHFKDGEFHRDETVITNESFLKRQHAVRKSYASKANSGEQDSDSAFSFAMNIRRNLDVRQHQEETSSFKIPKAYDTVMDDDGVELIGKRCRFDSKGYRILDQQVPDYDKMTSADVIRMLKSRIIYNHDDFLAIDKPYGLPSFGQQHDRLSVSALLPALISSLPQSFHAEQLHIVQGLDRDVTGALILAKSPEVAHDLKSMYDSSDYCIQRFWAITKGVPKPPEGTVDIPIGEGRVAGTYKRMLRPLYRSTPHPGVKLSKAPSEAATTQYKLLSRNTTAALIECTPLTNGVKHQVRVHLAYGLNTPILGDHKYSHFSRLAPQKLDPNLLGLLKIRQAKARHLALHLHLRTVVLANYKGRMIFLTTRPPAHFVDNLRSLKLHMPKK